MRRIFVVFLFLLLSVARGAPLERDLGQGLVYYRAATLPTDLPAIPPAAKRAYVLDLRYAGGNEIAALAVQDWLTSHAAPRRPVFVLANTETQPAVLASLARHGAGTGILVLGVPGPGFVPDIPLKLAPEAERQAYDALATLNDPEALLKENASKVRNDEARLAREHLPDSAVEDPVAATNDAAPPATGQAAAPKVPGPVIDVVLQRAVHLHRALVGLKLI
jgi:hypothetical protein